MPCLSGNAEVVVSGMGVVTPLGDALGDLWTALIKGQTAVQHWDDLAREGFRIPLAARAAGVPGDDARRGARMAVAAARSALNDARLDGDGRIGVFVGTTMGESRAFELAAAGAELDLAQSSARAFPGAVQAALGLRGPARAYATACAAGNYAIGAAARAVASGRLDVALAGGVEPLSRIALAGFSRSRAMSGERCRPFDRDRSGMQLGEAAAFFVIERRETALARAISPRASIHALGLSCDAYHPTAPNPDGSGMAAAMRQALEQTGALPRDVGWICAHGSGTRASDAAEALAIRQVFGAEPPAVSGLKGALGHSMGAAAAVEAVVTVLALQHKLLPPTVNLTQPDPECALDVFATPRPAPQLRLALNCGYGFGGLNSALLLGVS